MRKFFVLQLIFLFVFISIQAQENIKINKKDFKNNGSGDFSYAWKNIQKGDFLYSQNNKGSYGAALKFYLEAYNYNQSSAELNYKIGVCYVQSIYPQKALPFLKKAYAKNPNLTDDITYFLARAYHSNYMFDSAIFYYKKAKSQLKDQRKLKMIDKKIEECKNGKKLVKSAQDIRFENLEAVNSQYDDYHPVIVADGSKMFFTSRRPNKTGDIDPLDGQYYEDIYESEKDGFYWTEPKNLVELNTSIHDACVGTSMDGKKIILYRKGDLYWSEFKYGAWTAPKPFPKIINSDQVESSACFSLDGKTLFFTRGLTSDPLTSNSDIYYSTMDEYGRWTEPKPLSDKVNSPYDENGLFMFADGKTLYFSSKGHNSIGGYDIFKTTLQPDGTWSEPENLGLPINTPDDDIFFTLEANGFIGYYSTAKEDTKGGLDIYKFIFIDKILFQTTEDNLIASIAEPSREIVLEKPVRIIKGKITDANGNPIAAQIVITDVNTGKVIFVTTSDAKTGEYLVSVPSGKNYAMTINKEGYLFYSENINLIDESSYKEEQKDITLGDITQNATVTLNNIFFDYGSANLRKDSYVELDNVVNFLKKNPNIKVEISGHTDNMGDYNFNLRLSQMRAEAVANYLISKGIEKNRIIAKGYGYSKPIADNSTPEGRAKNRRVEFKIISQ